MEILNISEDTDFLVIEEIPVKESKGINFHILHSGKINKQILKYIVFNTKISFEEIKKLLIFDFTKAEKGETIIRINGIEMRR